MVRVGFIVEGESEKIVIDSTSFRKWASRIGIAICDPVIDAGGGGNLLPANIVPMINQVRRSNPDCIVILTDLERETTVEAVRSRIGVQHADDIFVAVKALEAWFLADTTALRHWLGRENAWEEFPEQTHDMPWKRLKDLAIAVGSSGPGPSKPRFARKYTNTHGFDLVRAADHLNCPSAKLFRDGLIRMAASFP